MSLPVRLGWPDVTRALTRRPATRLTPPCARQAAVAVIGQDGPHGIELLFVRRAEHPRDPWSGHMAFPGGRAEPQDRDLLATAMRETREEIDVDLEDCSDSLGALDEIQAMRRNEVVDLSIRPFVFRLRELPTLTVNAEIVSVHWVPLSRLFDPTERGLVPVADGGPPRQRPCIHVDGADGVVIWGLTLRMLDGLAQRLDEARTQTAHEGG